MTVGRVEEFLAILERSKLLKPEEVSEVHRLAKEESDHTVLAKTLVRKGILTRWQAGQLLAGRSKCTVGKYKLLELLGRGGMGSVYLGEHVMMNRRVALKIIPRHIGKDPAGLERFLAEARTIASLDHPNVVQAYSVDNEGDQYYLVMEYVEGLDLKRLVEAEGPLDCASAVDYMRQAADGLTHAHARKMIHCDIKPSNLIVNPQGVVKILDMGLARLAGHEQDGGEVSGQDERILGSVDYMAPEQALHTPDFDHRADIYSLGCTLYFLLTGHPPFPEGTLPERILRHQTQEPRAISLDRSDVPLSLIQICQRMMSKRPANRYQTAAEVSQVLAAWRPGEKRVQRVLELKKAEPIDELPSPDLLGTDLSELFRKGVEVSATIPIIGKKPPPTPAEKMRTVLRSMFSTPPRTIATVGISGAVIVLLAIAVIMLFGQKGEISTAQVEGYGTSTTSTGERPEPPKPEPPKPEPPKPEPPQPETPQPETPQSETPQSETPPPETPQPETPQPELEKIEPLKNLAESVELPEITKVGSQENIINRTASLGTVQLPQGVSLQLVLIGGAKAVKGTDSIVMKKSSSDGQAAVWKIFVETATEENSDPYQPIEIAQLRLNGENLQFAWKHDVTPVHAEGLKKCGVLAFAQGQRRFVQLCRPRQAKPLVLDFDKTEKNAGKVSIQLESLPDVHNLGVQITDREGPFPPNALRPSDTLEILPEGKSEITMFFIEEKFANFTVKIIAELVGKKLELETTAFYEIPGQQQIKVFKPNEAQELATKFTKQQNSLEASFAKLPDGTPRKAEAGRRLEQLRKVNEFLKDLSGLYQALNKQGKIHYNVFILHGKYKIQLFNTQIPVVEVSEAKDANQTPAGKAETESQSSKKPAPKKSRTPKSQ